MGREQFARMKPTAFFVTTARGPVHDEDALYDALGERHHRGRGHRRVPRRASGPVAPAADARQRRRQPAHRGDHGRGDARHRVGDRRAVDHDLRGQGATPPDQPGGVADLLRPIRMPASACGPRSQCRDAPDQERQGARAARPSGDRRRRPLGRAVPGLLRLHRRGREPGRRRHGSAPATGTGSTAGTSSPSRSGGNGACAGRRTGACRSTSGTAPPPRIPGLFYDSLDDWGIDLAIVFPSVGLTLGRDIADPELEQRRPPGLQHDGGGPVLAVPRPHGAGRRVEPGRADRGDRADGARARSRPEGARHRGHDPAHHRGRRRVATGSGQAARLHRRARCRQPLRLRPGLAAASSTSASRSPATAARWAGPTAACRRTSWGTTSGHFAQSHHTFARSLFLGGVTERFPTLNFGFLEGGVGWACNLYGDLFGHWEKRNRAFMDEHLKPTNLDTAEFRRLFEQYTAGNPRYEGKIDDIIARTSTRWSRTRRRRS